MNTWSPMWRNSLYGSAYIPLGCLLPQCKQRRILHVVRYTGKRILQNFSKHTMSGDVKPMVAVCQMTCTADKENNFQISKSLIERAHKRGAKMVFLPEAVDYIGETKSQSILMAETLEGRIITQYRELAKQLGTWISVGGFHQKNTMEDAKRVLNTQVIIDSDGEVKATYSKTHLFDLDIKDKVRLCESDYTTPGPRFEPPVQTPVGKVGLAICYDLRFPEFSLALAQGGAEILTYPSAFTQTTGMAHWEVLLRSRAIESQCYVLAAAQTGKHNEKRSSYGHAMIIDPWGTVIAQCREGTDVCVAEIDLDYLQKVREQMPVMSHRRHDLYGHIHVNSKGRIEEESDYQFGQHVVRSSQVFYRSSLSFACVNIKPVLPGHVLVCPLRPAKRFSDLTQPEIADLFTSVQRITNVIEKHYNATSATVAIQDGADAGQTVKHVHVHILPRKPDDLPKNDDIYHELERHDKNLEQSLLRSEEDMGKEALELRPYFK